MTKKTKFWLPLLVAMLMVATVVVAACAETATVSYAKGADGATGTVPEAQVVTVGEEIELIANPFTYEGHTFAGWSDGSKTYKAGDKYKVSGNVTFTATWTKVSGGEEHKCDHVCDQCGKCTDQNCKDPACADKCQGHQSAPVLDARSYFLRGSINGWTTEGYVFTRTEGTNTYTLEGVELKAGDAIKLCYNSEWTVGGKQMSYGAYFFPENVFGTSDQWDGNAVVKSGADGIYDITLKTSNNLTATTERGEGQITEFTFTKVGDIQKPVEPFAKAHFNGALGSMTSMDILSVLSFSEDGYVFAMVVEATNSYGCDARYTVAEDGTITITDGGDTIGTGTIVGNVITVTITLDSDEDSTSKQFTFTGEMYEATLIQDGESAEMYIAEGTPLYLLVMWGDEDVVVKVNGNVVPRDQLATTKMPKEKVTIEIISPEKPIESDITGPINAVILHSSKTQSGAQIEGTLWLNEMEYGSLMLVNKNSGLTILECYFDYELADGIITFTSVYDEDDNPVKATISGKVVGRTITITVTNTINGTPTEYVFESTLHKLTISKVMNMDYNYVWYLPAGYAYTDFVLRVPEGYVLSKVLVNGDEREASYIESISISEDTVVELVWEEEKAPEEPLMSEFVGKQFGFESASDAGEKLLQYKSNFAGPYNTYKAELVYDGGMYKLVITYYTGKAEATAKLTLYTVGGSSSQNQIKEENAPIGTYALSAQTLWSSATFAKSEDGQYSIIFNLKEGEPITWYEVGVEHFGPTEPEHECESKCSICQGCLNTSCQEEACQTKCQGHEDHTYDGTYKNEAGTPNFYDGDITSIVLNGNTMTLNFKDSTSETVTLSWSENVGTGSLSREDSYYYWSVTVTVGDEMLTIKFSQAPIYNFTFEFYTDDYVPDQGGDDDKTLADYQGDWTGKIIINDVEYVKISISGNDISISDAEGNNNPWTIDQSKIVDGQLVITFYKSSTIKRYYGTLTFTSDTTLKLEIDGGNEATFTLGGTTDPVESDITEPVNAIILYEEGQYAGWMKLYADDGYSITGYFLIYSKSNPYDFILEGNFEYTLANGVITIHSLTDDEYEPLNNLSGSGKVVGRTITITIADSSNDATYVFESELFKLTILNLEDWYAGTDDTIVYLPAGYKYEPDIFDEVAKVTVNGQEVDVSYLDSISISEDTVVEIIWKTSGGGYSKNIADYEGIIWEGEISFNNCDYIEMKIEGGKVWFKDKGYDFSTSDAAQYTVNTTGDLLEITFTLGGCSGTVTFNTDGSITIHVVKTGIGALDKTADFTRAE